MNVRLLTPTPEKFHRFRNVSGPPKLMLGLVSVPKFETEGCDGIVIELILPVNTSSARWLNWIAPPGAVPLPKNQLKLFES